MSGTSIVGKSLMKEKILNVLPSNGGMSTKQVSDATGMLYHTARNYLLELLEEGKVFVWGKDGKTYLYSANEYTKHTVLPRIKKTDGSIVTIGGGAGAIINQGQKFALSKEVRELVKIPYVLEMIAHEIVRECEGIGADPEKVQNYRLILIRLLQHAEECAAGLRQWIHHEALWDTENYIKMKSDPEYWLFANTVRQAYNIVEGREVYLEEVMYPEPSQEDLDTVL